jgi:hypothetical protein
MNGKTIALLVLVVEIAMRRCLVGQQIVALIHRGVARVIRDFALHGTHRETSA